MVPGSTLMYGSSLMRVTLRPRDSSSAARDAEAMPLPSEDTTPPVTNTYLVMTRASPQARSVGNSDYRWPPLLDPVARTPIRATATLRLHERSGWKTHRARPQ